MANKLTKAEITESIIDKTGYQRHEVNEIINAVYEEIKSALENRKAVEFRGFGSFEVRIRRGKSKARNPKTGEPVKVKDHGVVSFKPGEDLRDKVWDKC